MATASDLRQMKNSCGKKNGMEIHEAARHTDSHCDKCAGCTVEVYISRLHSTRRHSSFGIIPYKCKHKINYIENWWREQKKTLLVFALWIIQNWKNGENFDSRLCIMDACLTADKSSALNSVGKNEIWCAHIAGGRALSEILLFNGNSRINKHDDMTTNFKMI